MPNDPTADIQALQGQASRLNDAELLRLTAGFAEYAGSQDRPAQALPASNSYEVPDVVPQKSVAAAGKMFALLDVVKDRVDREGLERHPELNQLFTTLSRLPADGRSAEAVAAVVAETTQEAMKPFKQRPPSPLGYM